MHNSPCAGFSRTRNPGRSLCDSSQPPHLGCAGLSLSGSEVNIKSTHMRFDITSIMTYIRLISPSLNLHAVDIT